MIMEFIWEQVDHGEIRQIESDRLKELVRKKKDTDNDLRQQLRIHGIEIVYSINCTYHFHGCILLTVYM